MKKFAILFIIFIAFIAVNCTAATYYVANGGSDGNPGTPASPFATIQKASDTAHAGDTIIVKPGAYAGAKFGTSGTSSAPIWVQGQPWGDRKRERSNQLEQRQFLDPERELYHD